jgi:hypothetical protein
MAATGYTPISLYYSTTPGAQPVNTKLVSGELALNITDGTLYYKDNANVVQVLAQKGGIGSFSAGTTGLTPSTPTGGAVVLGGVLNAANGGTGLSSPGAAGNVLTSNGTTGWVSSPAPVGGATLSNDTSTATNRYPVFADATTGAFSTAYTSNANYLYKPSTGELQSKAFVATNGLVVNSDAISTNYTVGTGFNAMSVGPVNLAAGVSVTVSGGQRWVVL